MFSLIIDGTKSMLHSWQHNMMMMLTHIEYSVTTFFATHKSQETDAIVQFTPLDRLKAETLTTVKCAEQRYIHHELVMYAANTTHEMLNMFYEQNDDINMWLNVRLRSYSQINEAIQLMYIIHNHLFNHIHTEQENAEALCTKHVIRSKYVGVVNNTTKAHIRTLKETQIHLAVEAHKALSKIFGIEFTSLRHRRIKHAQAYCKVMHGMQTHSANLLSFMRITQTIYAHCIDVALSCFHQHMLTMLDTTEASQTNAYKCADMALNVLLYSNDICFEITSHLAKQIQAIAIIHILNNHILHDCRGSCNLSKLLKYGTLHKQESVTQVIHNVFSQTVAIAAKQLQRFNITVFGTNLAYIMQNIFQQNSKYDIQISQLINCVHSELIYMLENIQYDTHFIKMMQTVVQKAQCCNRLCTGVQVQCNIQNINIVYEMIDTEYITLEKTIDYMLYSGDANLMHHARTLENICIVPCWSHVTYVAIEGMIQDIHAEMHAYLNDMCKQLTINTAKLCCITMVSGLVYYVYHTFYGLQYAHI